MAIYARPSGMRTRQILGDLGVVAWGVVWGIAGRVVYGLVYGLAQPMRDTAKTASGIRDNLRQAAEQAGKIPVVGGGLRTPFDGAAGGISDIVTNATNQAHMIENLGTLLGWLIFLIPVLTVVAFWLPRRIRFMRQSRAAQRFIDSAQDLDLFALRAMATQPMVKLAAISPDPVGAWRSGDRAVIARLADLELRRSGLTAPRLTPVTPSPPPVTPSLPPVEPGTGRSVR